MECDKTANIFLAIFLSFFSGNFYRQVAKCWRAKTFLYLLVLLIICCAAVSFTRTTHFWKWVSVESQVLSEQMPVIVAQNGILKTEQPGPFMIKWPKNGNAASVFAIVDTTNQVKNFAKTPAVVIIQQKEISVKSLGSQYEVHPIPQDLSGTFNPKEIHQHLHKTKSILLTLAYIATFSVCLVFGYIYRFMQALIYALIGMLFALILNRDVDYVAVLNLSLVAVTPAIVLGTIATVFCFSYPFIWLGYFALSMIYLFFAVKACPKRK